MTRVQPASPGPPAPAIRRPVGRRLGPRADPASAARARSNRSAASAPSGVRTSAAQRGDEFVLPRRDRSPRRVRLRVECGCRVPGAGCQTGGSASLASRPSGSSPSAKIGGPATTRTSTSSSKSRPAAVGQKCDSVTWTPRRVEHARIREMAARHGADRVDAATIAMDTAARRLQGQHAGDLRRRIVSRPVPRRNRQLAAGYRRLDGGDRSRSTGIGQRAVQHARMAAGVREVAG